MNSIQIPHYSLITKLKNEIKQLAYLEKNSSDSNYMSERAKIIKALGFSSDFDFDEWTKEQLSKFDEIQNDIFRIKAFETPPQHYTKMRYYYFETNISLTFNINESTNKRWPFAISSVPEPKPLMSIWVGKGVNNWDEIREPSNDVAAERVYQRHVDNNELIYVIDNYPSFSRWLFHWGGAALIEDRLFTDEYIGTDMLERYECVNHFYNAL